jgi:hypothetical protein
MTVQSLPAALRAAAQGIYALEAATGLIVAHRTWLERDDFAPFIHHDTDTAAIDWEAAIGALDIGELPSSAGEKRMLRLAASLAGQAPSSSVMPSPGSTSLTSGSCVKQFFTPPDDASSPPAPESS